MAVRSCVIHILIEKCQKTLVTARSRLMTSYHEIPTQTYRLWLQYHPESIGTPDGLSSIRNFIEEGCKVETGEELLKN